MYQKEAICKGVEKIIVFHPQMNPKPRHSDFSNLRKQFYCVGIGNKIIYITANWADGTTLNDSENSDVGIIGDVPFLSIVSDNSF